MNNVLVVVSVGLFTFWRMRLPAYTAAQKYRCLLLMIVGSGSGALLGTLAKTIGTSSSIFIAITLMLFCFKAVSE